MLNTDLKLLKVSKLYRYTAFDCIMASLIVFLVQMFATHNKNLLTFGLPAVVLTGLLMGVILSIITRNSIKKIFVDAEVIDAQILRSESFWRIIGITFIGCMLFSILMSLVWNLLVSNSGFLFMSYLLLGDGVWLFLNGIFVRMAEKKSGQILYVSNRPLFMTASRRKYYKSILK